MVAGMVYGMRLFVRTAHATDFAKIIRDTGIRTKQVGTASRSDLRCKFSVINPFAHPRQHMREPRRQQVFRFIAGHPAPLVVFRPAKFR